MSLFFCQEKSLELFTPAVTMQQRREAMKPKTNISLVPEFKSYFAKGRAPNGFASKTPKFSDIPEFPKNAPPSIVDKIALLQEMHDKKQKLEDKKEPLKEALKELEDKIQPIESEMRQIAKEATAELFQHCKVGRADDVFFAWKWVNRIVSVFRTTKREVNPTDMLTATMELLEKQYPKAAQAAKDLQATFEKQTTVSVTEGYIQYEPAQGNK